MSGTLYVVATPIGNLDDISKRAIEVLTKVDLIAAEDTRNTQYLLQHLGLKKTLISLHDHNEAERLEQLINHLEQGRSIALVSDAGTPLISDPGFLLVQKIHEAKLPIVPIPGACAAIAALSVAGLASHQFKFIGFLVRKGGARRETLKGLVLEKASLIFYEAPRRLADTVADLITVFGEDRLCTMARELTKIHEQIWRSSLIELARAIEAEKIPLLGEIVLIVEGNNSNTDEPKQAEALRILTILKAELPLKQAVQLASKITAVNKNWLYQQALLP